MIEIKYNTTGVVGELGYSGRNGCARQVGLELLLTGKGTVVTLSPMNKRGVAASTHLEVPVSAIPELIAALQNMLPKP